jgi:hypothetical protein
MHTKGSHCVRFESERPVCRRVTPFRLRFLVIILVG